ncbi:hypothetical protein RCO48_23690 [Peribacillus frigoritolerans]|nr:hypothetical protein [Peribacillus frigoritolerans]
MDQDTKVIQELQQLNQKVGHLEDLLTQQQNKKEKSRTISNLPGRSRLTAIWINCCRTGYSDCRWGSDGGCIMVREGVLKG